jgi:hypothetical protein
LPQTWDLADSSCTKVDVQPRPLICPSAKAIKPMLERLKKKGLTLCVLPSHRRELNRIEMRWRKVRYAWLAFKTRDSKTLEADLDEIFAQLGGHYRLTF